MEEWKVINGYPGYYVSSFGRIKSFLNKKHRITETGKILSSMKDRRGYYYVNLYNENREMKSVKVHRLVATAFIENPNNFLQVNHKDEDKANNKVSNLEWCSAKYNVNYGTGHSRSCLTRRKSCNKAIVQYSLEGKVIREFYSLSEASRVLGISLGSISDCLHGRTSKSRTFIFRYKE